MKLLKLRVFKPVMGIGRAGTSDWLTSDEVDMELRADGSIRVTRLHNVGWDELTIMPANVAWYVPQPAEPLPAVIPTIGEPQPHPAYPEPDPKIWSDPAPNAIPEPELGSTDGTKSSDDEDDEDGGPVVPRRPRRTRKSPPPT